MRYITSKLHDDFPGYLVSSGEIAWTKDQILSITNYILSNKIIILGGDVYSEDGRYEYASWHYDPISCIALEQNVAASITTCKNYINDFSKRNGKQHLYVLVLSEAYVGGMK